MPRPKERPQVQAQAQPDRNDYWPQIDAEMKAEWQEYIGVKLKGRNTGLFTKEQQITRNLTFWLIKEQTLSPSIPGLPKEDMQRAFFVAAARVQVMQAIDRFEPELRRRILKKANVLAELARRRRV